MIAEGPAPATVRAFFVETDYPAAALTSYMKEWACLLLGALAASPMVAAAEDSSRHALEGAIQVWTAAVNSRDEARLTETMTAGVALFDGKARVHGRDAAIRALIGRSHDTLGYSTLEITIVDDVAWHVVALSRIGKDAVAHPSGQAMEIWKREDGSWRLYRRMTSAINGSPRLERPSTKDPVLDPAQPAESRR